MGNARTILGRLRQSTSRPATRAALVHSEPLDRALVLVDTICRLAGADDLIGPGIGRLQEAILDRDTPYLFEHLVGSFSLQGISDRAALTYMDNHDRPTWQDLQQATSRPPACPKMRGYWTFCGCGYRKAVRTCAEPAALAKCSVPRPGLRNGRLNQMTYSLFFFIRDVTDGHLIDWIDRSLTHANSGKGQDRLNRMGRALTEPLRNVYGVSDKLLNMTLADILLAAPASKPLWQETGFNMIAIDTLVHNFFIRTGLASQLGVSHAYGPACYSADGCADIVRRIGRKIDARQFNPDYPRNFPRFVQHAIWRYCAQSELNICNGNNIDDRFRCTYKSCTLYHRCSRVGLHA